MIASLDRAADHAVVVGVLVVIAAVGWLVQLAARRRAGRPHSDRGTESTERPDS